MNRQLVLLLLAVSMAVANPTDERKKPKEEFANKVKEFRHQYGDSASLRACEETLGLCGECDKFKEEQFELWRKYSRTCEADSSFFNTLKCRLFYGGPDEEIKKRRFFWPNQLRGVRAFSIQLAAERVREADSEKRKEDLKELVERLNKLRKIEEEFSKN